mmetsp:Transcript_24960/g.54000  ORF Transcript_24960/g.54000 Transcript_24960/m.54000 type:complete len:111 (+) Transcript_24960:130-462(+)
MEISLVGTDEIRWYVERTIETEEEEFDGFSLEASQANSGARDLLGAENIVHDELHVISCGFNGDRRYPYLPGSPQLRTGSTRRRLTISLCKSGPSPQLLHVLVLDISRTR